jgi:hypothetical protein
MKTYFILSVFIFTALTSFAQKEPISSNSTFKDGLYLSVDDFRKNRPTLPLDSISYSEKEDDNGAFRKILYGFKLNKSGSLKWIKIKKIWGICINGIPYINQHRFFTNVSEQTQIKDYIILSTHGYTFTRIAMIGHLCFIPMEGIRKSSYYWNQNPYNQKTKKFILKKYIIKLSTGETVKFNRYNLMKLIMDDKNLVRKLKRVNHKKEDEVLEILLQYNEKHPLYFDEEYVDDF